MALIFITGPVRSGKSRFAERLARERRGAVTYVATARRDPSDAEWTARLARHAASRPGGWNVVETATENGPALADVARTATRHQTLLVESLGTWLADRMTIRLERGGEAAAADVASLESELSEAVDALLATSACVIVVGEEVGWGVVPPSAAGRTFRDVLGRAQQRLAGSAERAYLVVAGFALDLGAAGRRVDSPCEAVPCDVEPELGR